MQPANQEGPGEQQMNSNDQQFLHNYFARYKKTLFEPDVHAELLQFYELCKRVQATGNKLIFAGNGASASISSHAATEFTQHAKIRSVCFNDHNLITAFANDYGYENWVVNALRCYADPGDVIVLISSSGSSPNIVNAATFVREEKYDLVTFSGFKSDNSLRKQGLTNCWVDSCAYNIVESVHLAWILAVANLFEQEEENSDSLEKHFIDHKNAMFETDHNSDLISLRDLCRTTSNKGGKIIFAGNGGSSSIASHAATDMTKQSKVRAVSFNDHNLITAFSNDYGQEHWIEKCIDFYADPNDTVVLFCPNGRSNNIINAANLTKLKNLPLVTFTGGHSTNPLRQLGNINFWVESDNYNVTETSHAIWICCVVDMLIGDAEYAVSNSL